MGGGKKYKTFEVPYTPSPLRSLLYTGKQMRESWKVSFPKLGTAWLLGGTPESGNLFLV